MIEPRRTRNLIVGGILFTLAEVLFFGGIAAVLYWLGGAFIIAAAIVAMIGLFFVWRSVLQFFSLRRGEW